MQDRNISLNTTAAYTLWVLGLMLIAWSMLTGQPTGALGLFVAGVGGVLTIRGFFCQQILREKAAFDLGRDSVRSIH